MEIKKSPKVDLENKKQLYMLIGYVLVLAIIFVAFEWTTRDVSKQDMEGVSEGTFVEELVPITMQETPPPPPPPPAPVTEEIINIVENTKEIVQVEIASTEDDQTKKQAIVALPPPVEEDPAEQEIFTVVEKMPTFPGGDAEMFKFINKNIKFPVIAAENGIQGRVICSFTVNKDGKIVDAVVVRGVDPSLDKEALRVISLMPSWTPGMQRGKPVRVKFTLPIMFRLS